MYPYKYALSVAEEFIQEISPFCEKREIAGSLKRKKQMVGDIDIVIIPKFEQTKDDTLFGEPVSINVLDRKLSQMCIDNQMQLETSGPKIKRFSQFNGSDIFIDLYIATPETWITILLIRTGSKEHNIKLYTRARDMRMQLKADGSGLFDAQLHPIKTESEEDIFKILGFTYVLPEERNL